MSTCEPSGGDPTHLFHYDQNDDPPEPDYLVSDGHVIPPDPLLESGTFIEVNPDPVGPTLTEPQSAQNGVSEHAQPDRCVDPEPVGEETEPGASHVAGGSTSAAGVTPEGTESTPSGRKGQPQVVSGALPERPKWLPEGWRMEYKVRSSGASAGSFDRYYFEPVSGLRFRSKVEVDYFLQNGSKPNKKRNADGDANANANSPQKSGSKKKKSAPLNFDFNNVPEKVRWVLTDAVKDQWTPFIGDKIIPKSTRQEWNAAFQFSCS